MNPVDYETEEYQAEQDALEQAASRQHADGTSGKRKLSPGREAYAKRARTGEPGRPQDPGRSCLSCLAMLFSTVPSTAEVCLCLSFALRVRVHTAANMLFLLRML